MTQKKKHTVLVIAAHPDDEVLGCGGAMARHVEEGDEIHTLILGEGIASRTGLSKNVVLAQQNALREDMREAHATLGTQNLHCKNFPDNSFDSVPLLAIVHDIEAVIAKVHPTLVYTHHASDTNVDHRIVSQAVEVAVRPMKDKDVREVRAFEVPSSSDWNFTRQPFRPQLFVALTEGQLQKKLDAMAAYRSEIREFPHPRSLKYLEALARVRGGQSGSLAAEAFEMVYARH